MKIKNLSFNNTMNRAGSSSKIGSLKKESLPNENIFKSDSDYKMKSTLSFNEYEEQTCKRNLFIRYCDIIKFMIIYCCLRNVYCLFTEWNHSETHWLISIMRIPICLILLFNGLMVINIDKFINNTIYMRLFLEIDNIFNIITSVRLDNRLIADETLSGSNFYYAAIMLKFIHGFVYNFSFCLTLDEYFIYYLIESATIISLLNHPNKLCLIRLVYNLFSYKSIYVFAIATFIMGLQYQIASALRELWALYDSFKRSYVNIKGIYDEFRYPVFVVKKLGLQVYFKNVEADKLLNRKKAREMGDRPQSKMSSRRATSKYDITLRDIFEKSELLEEEICKCLRNKSKCFNFPMNIGNKTLMYKENDNFPTMYEGDLESVEWVKILVFECQWKGNEALMIQIVNNNSNIKNNLLLSEINKELGIVIDNINLICEKSPEVCNHNSLKSPGTNSLKSRKMSISPTRNNNKLLRYTGAHNNSACKSIESGSIINLKSVEPIESIVSPQKKMPNEIRTPFDYATLYLMKNNINFIYDTFLTLQVFSSLRTNKIYQTLSRFNFESFLCYMITYIQPLAKLKNFKIEYNTDLSEEIEAIYEYYRVIIFNILVHIMNNTRNLNSEKHLKIKVEHNSYSPTLGSYYKIIFEFKDNDYIVPYDKLNEIFSTLDNTSLSMIDLEKMMIIDIGLIVTYFLCSTVYNAPHPRPTSFSAMSIDRSSHIIIVSIYVPAKKDIRINEGEGIVEKRFTDIKAASIEDKYYKKIVERLYQHVYDERIGDTRVSGNRSRYKKRSTVDKFKYTMYDDGKNEWDNEEEGISIAKDVIISREMKLIKYDRISSLVSKKTGEEVLETKFNFILLKKINSPVPLLRNGKPFFANWDNSSMKGNIKYCKTPRFLIVEDNVLGRISITDELKKIKLRYMLDYASDGMEAVEKFKILLNRGYAFDFIFMDIYLREMSGFEATKLMRQTEREYNFHTNIACVTVEGKNEIEVEIFDEYFEKPIKNCDRLYQYISSHFKNNRPEIKL